VEVGNVELLFLISLIFFLEQVYIHRNSRESAERVPICLAPSQMASHTISIFHQDVPFVITDGTS
jgi:hypothetical protein